jgi:uncharacterized membrane protein/cytochrome c5
VGNPACRTCERGSLDVISEWIAFSLDAENTRLDNDRIAAVAGTPGVERVSEGQARTSGRGAPMNRQLDWFYDALDRIGYTHPIHPALVHMPIGLVVGATAFIGMAAFSRYRHFRVSGHHVLTLALIFWFPTVLFGITDWQRYLGGAWLFVIKVKLALAVVLFVLLVAGVILGFRGRTPLRIMASIYGLCFATVVALGYFGGQLVYAGRAPPGPPIYRAGEKIFDQNCSGCHAHGGNVIAPNLPLSHAPELAQFEQFNRFIRHPRMPNGAVGDMPAFLTSRISDEEVKALYDYIVHTIAMPSHSMQAPPSSLGHGSN